MAVRTIVGCDSCGAEPADPLVVDVGDGALRVDLCRACQDAAGLPKLEALLADYGVAAATKPAAKRSPPAKGLRCPRCDGTYPIRQTLISHLANTHALGLVEASKLAPPPGEAVTCPDCGYLAQAGQGIAQHRARQHRG